LRQIERFLFLWGEARPQDINARELQTAKIVDRPIAAAQSRRDPEILLDPEDVRQLRLLFGLG